MGTYAWLAIALLIVGLLLLLAEVFIPSGGILGTITVALLIGAIVYAWSAWGRSQPRVFWLFVATLMVLVPSTLIGAFRVLPQTRFGKRVLLEAPAPERLEPFADETARLERFVGRIGKALSALNPGGMVTIDGNRLHAFTEGLVVERHEPIRIVAVRGTRVLVRSISAEELAAISRPSEETGREAPSMDFDFPDEPV
jgi:membrane-bound serine protease (ClpP class)